MVRHEGGCLCGTVRYAVTAEPVRVTICHCTFCQRATGSAYLVEPIFAAEHVTFIADPPNRYEHRSKGSGKIVHVHFCARCGTKLALTFERFPGSIGVYAGTLDAPGWVMQFPKRTMRIFLDDAMTGTIIPPGVPVWRQHRIANDGTAQEPLFFSEHHIAGGTVSG